MAGPDDGDEFDDDLFSNFDADALQQIDSVISASQAPKRQHQPSPPHLPQRKPKVVSSTHHVLARPANRPSQASNSRPSTPQAGPSRPVIPHGSRAAPRDPGPLNTEPRTGKGGFGWEHGGKRQEDAERYIAQVDDRQQYWGTGGRSNITNGRPRGQKVVEADEDEDEPPMVEMNPNGTYRHVPTPDVVDKHAKPSIALPATRRQEDAASLAAGAEARRRAMMAAMQLDSPADRAAGPAAAGPGPSTVRQMTKATSGPVQQLQQQHNSSQRFPSPNGRTLSRSISAGHHPMSKPIHYSSRAMSPQLATIPAESSQATPPASQGSLARKAALEADSIQRAKEALEKELATVKRELDEERRRAEEREKKENDAAMRDDFGERGPLDEDGVDWKKKYEEERNKVFTSEGAASSVRRRMQTMEQEHKAGLEKLQAAMDDMALKAKEKERDTARQLENVKTQAVFSNHAVLSSAIKRRHDTGSQRPPGSPSKFVSPRGKAMEESFLQRTAGKSKGRAMLPPPEPIIIPQPKFTAFNNAFNASPRVTRVKRQRTESVAPRGSPSPSPSRRSPQDSPSRRLRVDERPDPQSPSPAPAADLAAGDDFDMGDGNEMTGVTLDEVPQIAAVDERSELLSHIFNYCLLSKFQTSFDQATRWQPVLYRILNYRPSPAVDRVGEYGRYCAELLQACGDGSIPFHRLVEILARCLAGCLRVVTPTLEPSDCPDFHLEEVVVSTDILSLCARMTWLFRGVMANGLFEAEMENCLKMLVERIYAPESARTMLQERYNAEIKAYITARRALPPSSLPDIPPNGTQRPQHNQMRAAQVIKPQQAAPEIQPDDSWKSWFKELAFAAADMAQAWCWFCADCLVSIALGLTAPHLPLDIVLRGMGTVWAAATFRGNFRYLMMPSATGPSAGGDPTLERLSRYLISPPPGPKNSVHQLTMLILRSLTMMSIAEATSILLVGQQSLVVPALVSVLRRSAVKIWGVCAEDVDGKDTMEITSHALYLFHHLLFPRYTNATLTPPRQSDDLTSYNHDGPDFIVPALPQASQARLPDDDTNARPQGINLVDVVTLHGAKREFVGLGHEFIATMGTIAFAQPVDESHGLDDGEMNSIQDMATAVLGELINGYEEDAIYELYDDVDDAEADEEAADDEAALQDVIVIQDDSD